MDYAQAIADQRQQIDALNAKLDRLANIDNGIAAAVSNQFKSMSGEQLAILVHKAERKLAQR